MANRHSTASRGDKPLGSPFRVVPFLEVFTAQTRSPEGEMKSKKPNPKKRSLFAARFLPKIAKNLFDASPCAATTSDQKSRFLKNITGFGPRDLLVLDSSEVLVEGG
jgi:hypothetical protein